MEQPPGQGPAQGSPAISPSPVNSSLHSWGEPLTDPTHSCLLTPQLPLSKGLCQAQPMSWGSGTMARLRWAQIPAMQDPMWVSPCPPSHPAVPVMLVAPSPTPSPCCSAMAAAHSSLHSMAGLGAISLCHAVSHFAAHRPHCKPQVRAAWRCPRPCARGMPPPRPRSRPPCPGRAGGTGPFPATCPHGPEVLWGHHLSQNLSCRC